MAIYKQTKVNGKELFPGIIVRPVWGEKIMMMLVDIAPNAEVPLHSHPHEQAGIVIEGELELGIGNEVRTVGPGVMYIIPGNIEHYARSLGPPAKVLDIFSPVREEFKY